MAGYINDAVRDAALNLIDSSVTHLYICDNLPTTYADASTNDPTGMRLGVKAGPTISTAADDTSGRKITISAITDGTVDVSGTASHWALTSGTVLYAAGNLSATPTISAGNTFTLTEFTINLPDQP